MRNTLEMITVVLSRFGFRKKGIKFFSKDEMRCRIPVCFGCLFFFLMGLQKVL